MKNDLFPWIAEDPDEEIKDPEGFIVDPSGVLNRTSDIDINSEIEAEDDEIGYDEDMEVLTDESAEKIRLLESIFNFSDEEEFNDD